MEKNKEKKKEKIISNSAEGYEDVRSEQTMNNSDDKAVEVEVEVGTEAEEKKKEEIGKEEKEIEENEKDVKKLKDKLDKQITDNAIEELLTLKQHLQEVEDNLNEEIKKSKELEDLLKRKQAEFENYRKRIEKEKLEIEKYTLKKIMSDLLPIVDTLEKAMTSIHEKSEEIETDTNKDTFKAFMEGMNLIEKQIKGFLLNYNVKPIESIGSEFDPNLHEAVQVVEDNQYTSDTVIGEWQKGYTIEDVIIRHSKVVVGKPSEKKDNIDKTEDKIEE